MIDVLLIVLVCVTSLWTLLPFFRHDAWWIRGFEFPRVQVTVLSLATLVAYVFVVGWHSVWDQLLLALLAGCVFFQLIRIARYTPPFPNQVKTAQSSSSDSRLSLLVANVLMPNRNAAALLQAINECNPDIVLTLETDEWWQSQLDALDTDYPYAVKHPLDNLYGMHLYSKLPLIDPCTLFLVEDTVPSIHATARLRSGHEVALHCLHPAPPSPTENATSAERDAELLIVAKALGAENQTAVVMGDLNDVAWSATTRMFQRISRLLDPRIGRGMYSTFHASYPFMRWPLDHVFCTSDFELVSLSRLGPIGSDHFPIHVVLTHSPNATHVPPSPEPGDHADAQEKIDKVGHDETISP